MYIIQTSVTESRKIQDVHALLLTLYKFTTFQHCHTALKKETVCFSETFTYIYKSTQHHNPEQHREGVPNLYLFGTTKINSPGSFWAKYLGTNIMSVS
jgi:hypothetical protein